MIRGFRGATTVNDNIEAEITKETKKLVLRMVETNQIKPEDISHVLFSVTNDLNASFPAKVARELNGWTHVPVMCMKEIDVPNSLPLCIRVMMVAKTELKQNEVQHVFLNEAIKLRPDLVGNEGD
ncbi:chorismate mutase [Pseudogracilibacillus sp. SO30301A]|uniref:chorismate mutase n=1 Tax=Pseudogracilibacillus sp. SO30301A TaxID=3098291 RepID=UPI00300E3C10